MYIPGLRMSDSRDLCWLCWRHARGRGVRSAHQSLRMLRSTWPSVDIERDIVSKSGAGMPGCTFFVVKSHGPYGTLGRPFACFERFYESSCLLCVVMMVMMIELPLSISQNRRYESTVSGYRTRIFEYMPVQDAPGSINARILIMDEISRRCNFRSDEFERFEWWTLRKVLVVVEVYIIDDVII